MLSSYRERSSAAAAEARLAAACIPPEVAGKDFSDFVADTERASAIANAMHKFSSTYATSRMARKGFLFIGKPGTAKTHIACAMAAKICASGMQAIYTSLPRFTRDLRAAFGRRGAAEELLTKVCDADFLVLDELDLHGSSDNDYNTLYDIINTRYERTGFTTVAISNRPLERLQQDLDERIVTRILAGTKPVHFDWEGRRQNARVVPSGSQA